MVATTSDISKAKTLLGLAPCAARLKLVQAQAYGINLSNEVTNFIDLL